jgi:uncharacterized OB-fold protein
MEKFIEESWFKKFDGELRLVGTHCIDCNKVFFPPKKVCPLCFDGKIEDVPLSKTGTLHTYARSVMGPPDLEKPFLMGFINIPEKIKIYSLITGCKYEDLKVGMPMEVVIEGIKKDSEGNVTVGYKFRPIREGDKKS